MNKTINTAQKVAIVVDDWKVPIFKDQLRKDGFTFECHDGVTVDTRTITVMTLDLNRMAKSVKAASEAAAAHRLAHARH